MWDSPGERSLVLSGESAHWVPLKSLDTNRHSMGIGQEELEVCAGARL